MFCAKCGHELPDNALFCGECGNKVKTSAPDNTKQQAIPLNNQEAKEPQKVNLKKESDKQQQIGQQSNSAAVQQQTGQQPVNPPVIHQRQTSLPVGQQPYTRTTAQPISLVTKVLLVEVFVFAVLAFVSYTKIKEYVSPEKVAKSYFTAVMSGDEKKAYNLIDVDESEFVNEKYFGELLKNIGQKNVYNFKVINTKDAGDDFKKSVKITYHLKEDTSDYNFYVVLEKSSSKKLFLFDDWKVNIGDYIQKDVTFYVNQGSKVTFNGVELSKKYLSNEMDGSPSVDEYIIPKIFSGTYEALITSDIYADCKMSFVVDEDNTTFYEWENGDAGMTLKPEIIENIAKQSQKDFKTFWSNAVQQKSFKSVNNIVMAEDQSEIKEDYENLVERFKKEDGEGLQKISFENFEVITEGATEEDDLDYPTVYVSFSAPFSCIEMNENWWSGELESSEGSGDYIGGMSYIYQSGEWKVQYISISDFYY